MIKSSFSICLIILIITSARFDAQAQKEISTEELDLSQDPSLWYDKEMGIENTPLQMGTWNSSERKAHVSHPYNGERTWATGMVSYRGQVYSNVPMLYNTFEDVLLVRQEGRLQFLNQPMEIVKSQVASFDVNGKHFEFYDQMIDNFKDSFFEVMFRNGEVELLAKRLKKIEIVSNNTSAYVERDRYYIMVKDEYVRIFRPATIIRQFKDYRVEIKKYIRENDIKILKPGTDYKLIKLVQYCDQISSK